jgi:Na+(H+)/acetate symporter ActP
VIELIGSMVASFQCRLALLTVLALSVMAGPALAQTTNPARDAANSSIAEGITTAREIVLTNIPLILGVVVLFVALRFGKKLLSKVG